MPIPYHIKLVPTGATASVEEIQHQVSVTLAEIDAQLSNYREDSEISQINRQENTEWISVSQQISDLLANPI